MIFEDFTIYRPEMSKIKVQYYLSLCCVIFSVSGFFIAVYGYCQDVAISSFMIVVLSPIGSVAMYLIFLMLIRTANRYLRHKKTHQLIQKFDIDVIENVYHFRLISVVTIVFGLLGLIFSVYGFIYRQYSFIGKLFSAHFIISNVGYIVIGGSIYKAVQILRDIRSIEDNGRDQ